MGDSTIITRPRRSRSRRGSNAPDITIVSQWSEEQVADFVGGIADAFQKYRGMFLENGVDGPTFLELAEHDLEEIGVKSRVHRKRILNAIRGSLGPDSTLLPENSGKYSDVPNGDRRISSPPPPVFEDENHTYENVPSPTRSMSPSSSAVSSPISTPPFSPTNGAVPQRGILKPTSYKKVEFVLEEKNNDIFKIDIPERYLHPFLPWSQVSKTNDTTAKSLSTTLLQFKSKRTSSISYYKFQMEKILHDHEFVVCVVPSQTPGKISSHGITALAKDLCSRNNRIDGTNWLIRHKKAPRMTFDGSRTKEDHLKTIKINPQIKDKLPRLYAPVLLLDDVAVTGNSLDACEQILRESGAKDVHQFTLTLACSYAEYAAAQKSAWTIVPQ